MRYLILILMLFPFFTQGQILGENQLWKGYGIKDTSDNPLPNKIQQFVTHNSTELYLCNIKETPNRETDEMELMITIDTFQIVRTKLGYEAVSPKVTLKLDVISKDDLRLYHRGYYFFFKLASEIEKSSLDIPTLKKEMLKQAYFTTEPEQENSIDGILKTVNEHTIVFKNEKNGESKENNYQIVDFQGFILLKAIANPALILNKMVEKDILFSEMIYNLDPKPIVWRKKVK